MKFGLDPKEFEILDQLLLQPLRNHGAKIWVFGSRARGDHKKYSDLDVLYQAGNLPSGLMYDIKTNLEESKLPIKVDIVNDSELAKSYRESVEKDRVEL
jgi:uncharacterized protein